MAKIVRKQKKTVWQEMYKALLTGVSYIIPLVVAGGMLQSLMVLFFGVQGASVAATPQDEIRLLGSSLMVLLVPLLSAYIAYGIGEKPALIPGLAGGIAAQGLPLTIAGTVSAGKAQTVQAVVTAANAHAYPIGAGFIGGIVSGLLAGYLIKYLKKIPYPASFSGIMVVLFYPLVGTLITGAVMLFVLGGPTAALTNGLMGFLNSMNGVSLIALGMTLGALACFDMGGPVNKAAYLFGVAMIAQGNGAPYAAFAAAKCIPPIAVALATFLAAKGFTADERATGKGIWILGIFGITEGAIPFALRDPLRVILPAMIGGGVAASISLVGGSSLPTTGGSLITLPVTANPGNWFLAFTIGLVITTALIAISKRVKVARHGADDLSVTAAMPSVLD